MMFYLINKQCQSLEFETSFYPIRHSNFGISQNLNIFEN